MYTVWTCCYRPIPNAMEETLKIDDKEHAVDVLNRLKSFRDQPKHCDFIIKAGGEELHVHRDVLCAGSNYFDAMLSHSTKEKESGVVELKNADVECVKKCVEFMYTGKACVAQEKRKDMMYVATLLQLQRLCNGIVLSLQESLDAASFCATTEIANTFSCKVLEETCKNFAMENFSRVVLAEGFEKLNKDYIDFLIKSMKTKASEHAKCKALLVWANANLDERSEFFEDIFGHLNLTKISLGYRRYLIEKESLVFSSNKCLKALLISDMDKANVLPKDFTIQGVDDGIENALTMFDKASKSVQVFEPEQKRWTRMQDIPDEINAAQFTAIRAGESIYTLLNNRTGHRLAFADAAATWIRTPDRATTTGKVTGFVLDGSLYSVDDNNASSVAIERLDPGDGTWVHVADKRKPHYFSTFFAYQGSFYCVGGFSNIHMADFERFDLDSSTWSELPPMPTARHGAAAVVLNGKLYVMGGHNGNYLSVVESFDFKSESWTTISNMNHTRYQFSACVLEDKIYAIGGTNSNNTIEVFDRYENTWNVVETMTGRNIQPEAVVATHMFA